MLGVLLELGEPAAEGEEETATAKTKKGKKGGGGGGGRLSYFLNGKPLGAAFDSLPLSSSSSSSAAAAQEGEGLSTLVRYYPALSMDEGEALRVNIGLRPFAFFPPDNGRLPPGTKASGRGGVQCSAVQCHRTDGMDGKEMK